MIAALRTFRVRPSLPPQLETLGELAANLRWAWHPPTQELFRWADTTLWDAVGGNPAELIGRLSPERLAALAGDATFVARVGELHADLERYRTQPRWAQSQPVTPPRVAYFSPEFGLSHAMQTYSGGLGVLAGDHLKAASDLGLDLVGVGLLYRHGYFRQRLDADGWQQEQYPDLNPYRLPLRRLESDDQAVVVEVELAGRTVGCQVWCTEVGRVALLLLDTDLSSNAPADRTVTDKLYGGDVEHRLRQEIVLGIGGVRALDAARDAGLLGEPPEVFHSNEGHAGFLQLERIRRLVTTEGLSFDEAVESSRASVLFTTHTPVPAGIDVFARTLMDRYFGWLASECGISMDRLMAVGQTQDTPPEHDFNMALMGLRLSARANGVSQLHGRVARRMFKPLWPGIGEDEIPITSVTNGVHAGTWVGPEMTAVYDRYLAPDWAHNPTAWDRVREISDDALWRARGRARERFVQRVRGWVREQGERRGEAPTSLAWAAEVFDPDALTIGFARRFAEYKRGTLLLRQPQRLRALLTATDRPVQIVFAGKAHPRDELGKDIIRQLVHFSGDEELRGRVVFVEDYDMDLAAVLVQGVDLWLNNPRRPHEACGTSGQKAVLNGALHCSTLDGWWDEMYDRENGFAIGSADSHPDAAQQDAADAQALFDLLERTVVPTFYDRTEGPLPRRWLARVRRSLATLAPQVQATRMVAEYTQRLYIPIAERGGRLAVGDHKRARQLAAWRSHVDGAWAGVRCEEVVDDQGTARIGERREVSVLAQLGELTPEDVQVELLHGAVHADGSLAEASTVVLDPVGQDAGGTHRYTGAFTCTVAGEYGFTVRIVPRHDDLATWTSTGLVAWAGQDARS
ncbi:MAG: alpha-glucan family phosphorylase [Egibacteraceae bacterium]